MKIAGEPLNGRSGHEAGRELLARLYREETGESCPEIAIADRGKPYFAESPWHFSISHTKRHVFCALSDRPVGLDAEETNRSIDLRLAGEPLNGRSGHEAGRELLARLYREETGESCPEIAIADRGKPYFAESPWHFSISHTKRHVFCALSDRPVGLDAEETDRSIDLRLAGKILSEPEKRRFDAAADKRAALLRFWVLKEAAAKLTGEGLRGFPNHTDFDPDDPRITELDGCYVAVLD